MTIGMAVIIAGSFIIISSQSKEVECLRLYKDIRELSRTPEMSLGERETIDVHKNLVFEYVAQNCPGFPDLKFIHGNYIQDTSESESDLELDYELDESEFLQIKNNMENVGYHICDIQLEENKILIVLNWIYEDSEPEKTILSQIPSNVSYEIKYLGGYADYFLSKESVFSCEGLENED